MKIIYLYSAMNVKDLGVAEAFYTKLLGRKADDHPMDFLVQWLGFSNAGIQLFKDPAKAGNSRMTLVVEHMNEARDTLQKQGLKLGPIQEGNFGKIAQLTDPDGNMITLAEPPKA